MMTQKLSSHGQHCVTCNKFPSEYLRGLQINPLFFDDGFCNCVKNA